MEDTGPSLLIQVLIEDFYQVKDLDLVRQAFRADCIVKHDQAIWTGCGDGISLDVQCVL